MSPRDEKDIKQLFILDERDDQMNEMLDLVIKEIQKLIQDKIDDHKKYDGFNWLKSDFDNGLLLAFTTLS